MTNYLTPIIVSVVILILFFSASRTRVTKNIHGQLILKYPIPTKLVGIILLLAGIIFTILLSDVAIEKQKDVLVLLTTFIVLFCILPLTLVIEFCFVKFLVNEDGIYSYTPWTKQRRIQWNEVTEVKYSPTFKWVTIQNNKTSPIHVGEMVAGLDEMFKIMEKKLPSEVYMKFVGKLK